MVLGRRRKLGLPNTAIGKEKSELFSSARRVDGFLVRYFSAAFDYNVAITDLPFIEYHGRPHSTKDLKKKREIDMYNLSLMHGTTRSNDDYCDDLLQIYGGAMGSPFWRFLSY